MRPNTKILAQYTGGEPPIGASISERFQWLVPMKVGFHNASGILISRFSPDERYQRLFLREYYKLDEKKLIDFPNVVVDNSLFYPRDRIACAKSLGFDPEKINVLVISGMRNLSSKTELVKNPFAVLKIFKKLKSISSSPWHLHIVGFGPAFPAFQEQVQKLGLTELVTLHGIVDHEALPAYYGACDLLIYPLVQLDVTNGTAISEALTCERPVMAFKRRPELATEQEGGFLLDMDEETGAQELSTIFSDRSKMLAKGKEGKKVSERYNLENVGPQLLKIYRDLLER